MSKKKTKRTTKITSTKNTSKSKGLGDTVEKITEATGIKKLVEFVAGEDCGCDERKEKLNKLFPYKTQPLCLEELEYNTLKHFFEDFDGREIKGLYHRPLSEIHARVFQHKFYIPCTCTPKEWVRMINDLRKVYGEYGSK